MYLAFHKRVAILENGDTSTRLGNVPKLLKQHKHGIIGAKQTTSQNGQVRNVPVFGSHYNKKEGHRIISIQ